MKKISTKLLVVMGVSLLLSFIMSNSIMYHFVNKSTYESAGIEAYGCANITSALIDLDTLAKAKGGDMTASETLSKAISWTVEHKEIFDKQYLLDLDGKVLVVDEAGKTSGMKIGEIHPISQETIQELVQHKMPTYTKEFYDAYGEETLTGVAPILDEMGNVVAISAIDFDSSVVADRTWDTISTIVGLSAIPLVLVGIVTFLYVSRVVKPLKKLADEVEVVIQGDLTRTFEIEQEDEIGRLSRSLTKLVGQFKNILSEVNLTTTQLASTSEELYASTQNISDISQQNTQLVETVRSKTNEQTENIGGVNEIINAMANLLNDISNQLKTFVTVTESTVQEATNGELVIKDTNEQMGNINNKIEKVSETMLLLQEKSKKINQIVELINDISKQTSMLSFNATIEAERAGEQGKGFTIVASEVRRLAEESATSTGGIATLVKEIQDAIENALLQTQDGKAETKEGIIKAEEAGLAFQKISNKVKTVSDDVTLSSRSVEGVANEINEIVKKMMAAVAELKETTETTNYVTAAIEAQNTSFKEIVDVSDVLSKQSEELQEKLTYFKM